MIISLPFSASSLASSACTFQSPLAAAFPSFACPLSLRSFDSNTVWFIALACTNFSRKLSRCFFALPFLLQPYPPLHILLFLCSLPTLSPEPCKTLHVLIPKHAKLPLKVWGIYRTSALGRSRSLRKRGIVVLSMIFSFTFALCSHLPFGRCCSHRRCCFLRRRHSA